MSQDPSLYYPSQQGSYPPYSSSQQPNPPYSSAQQPYLPYSPPQQPYSSYSPPQQDTFEQYPSKIGIYIFLLFILRFVSHLINREYLY
jgi:hypothetical protein